MSYSSQAGWRKAHEAGANLQDFPAEDISLERLSIYIHLFLIVSWLPLLVCLSVCHLTPPDLKLCPIPMTPNGHLDPSLPLGGHLGPVGAMGTAPRLSLQPDPVLVALDSRKSSVMSLGRMSYDQRSLVSPVAAMMAAGGGGTEGMWHRCPGRGYHTI